MRVPAWPLRCLAGEMSTLLLDGQRAVTDKVVASGYVFQFAKLGAALADLAQSSDGKDS